MTDFTRIRVSHWEVETLNNKRDTKQTFVKIHQL